MRPTTFCKTVGDVETEAHVNTMHHSLAEVEAERRGDTLRDVEVEASADTLADMLPEEKRENVGETLTYVKGVLLA